MSSCFGVKEEGLKRHTILDDEEESVESKRVGL